MIFYFIFPICLVIVLLANTLFKMKRHNNGTVDLSDPAVLLKVWLSDAAAKETKEGLHQHIIKHAMELVGEVEETGTYESWSASMHNLLTIYDEFHYIFPDTDLQLERMTAKYISNPNEGTVPPTPLPSKIVAGARGPSIEVRKSHERRAQIEARQKSYYSGGS